jgi:hypothetical protein
MPRQIILENEPDVFAGTAIQVVQHPAVKREFSHKWLLGIGVTVKNGFVPLNLMLVKQ